MAAGVAAVWLPVTDMDRAVAFYRDVLELTITGEQPQWSEVDANGVLLGLNAREQVQRSGAGGAVISFQPDGDLESEVERLRGAGVEFTGDVSEYDWGRLIPFKDSEGNDLQLYAPPRS